MPEKVDSTAQQASSSLLELKRLLLSEEQQEITEIRRRLDDPKCRATEISKVLSDSLRLSGDSDDSLPEALERPLIEGIQRSVNRDPNEIAGILFPVMGPSIRSAITDTFKGMVESINRSLEYGLSYQGFKWRLESLRTGVPFSEVILRNTLHYRVEEVLLIRSDSGLLIDHVADANITVNDPDAVSAMLTAISDFVRDSFISGEGRQSLDEVELGDHTVLMVHGPHAYLAAAVRGIPPSDLKARYQHALEGIHRRFGPYLSQFDGSDPAPVQLDEKLQECLFSEEKAAEKGGRGSPLLWIVLLATILLGWYGYERWQGQLEADRKAEAQMALQTRQDQLLALIGRQPGILVTGFKWNEGMFSIEGMKDPLAMNPDTLLEQVGLSAEGVQMSWKPYQDMAKPFVVQRVMSRLKPPKGVTVELDQGRLRLAGVADGAWIRSARLLALTVFGVEEVDDSGLSSEPFDFDAAVKRLQPPERARLRLNQGVLYAQGVAESDWINAARQLAPTLDGIERYDDADLLSSDQYITNEVAKRLQLPERVKMEVSQGRLVLTGVAGHSWRQGVEAQLEGITGLTGVDMSALEDEERIRLNALRLQLEEMRLFFSGHTQWLEDQQYQVADVAVVLKEVFKLCHTLSLTPTVMVAGYTDGTGGAHYNEELRLARAQQMVDDLLAQGVSGDYLHPISAPPSDRRLGMDPALKRVDFKLQWSGVTLKQ